MSWEADLEIVVKRTGVEHYRKLCSEAYHDHKRMREKISLMAREPEFPSLAAQAGNALGALGRAAGQLLNGGPVLVDTEELERRLAICRACDQYRDGRCLRCGCAVALKARLESETGKCPLLKW
jgi:Family of unknown function (DUF6171)